jgi:tetratricopeptide (TPR) repeat protein
MQRIVLAVLGVVFLLFFPVSIRNYLALSYEQQAERVLLKLSEWDDPESVFHIYQKAARSDPGSYRAAFALAAYYGGRVGDDPEANREVYNQALHWYSVAIRNNPHFVPGYEARMQLYLSVQETKRARADCEKLSSIDPFQPKYRFTLGEMCLVEADYDCARKQFELAHKLAVDMSSPLAEPAKNYLELLKDVPRPEDGEAK